MSAPTIERPLERTVEPSRFPVTTALLAVALVLWIISVPRIHTDAIGSLGLLSALPLTFYLAVAVLAVSMVRATLRGESSLVLAAHVALFLLIVHGTPAIVYETLRYGWAWKHLGVIDYLAQHHHVDPDVQNIPIYQNWPGFFSLGATWLVGSGLTSWAGVVQWAPLFFQCITAVAVYTLLQNFDTDRRVVWFGVWFYVLGNWIGQDYFSPQALAFFCYVTVLALVVRYFTRVAPVPGFVARLPRGRAVAAVAAAEREASDRGEHHTRGVMTLTLLVIAAIVTSHPLTPYVLIAALTLLALTRALRRWDLPLVVAGMTMLWMATGGRTYVEANAGQFVNDIGKLSGSVEGSLSKAQHADAAQSLVSQLGRMGIAVLALVAVVAIFRRFRAGRWDIVPVALMCAPAAILFGSNYGGEAGFRVYLFALPLLAFFAATQAVSGSRRVSATIALLLSGVLFVAFAFGYYGKEQWVHFSRSEVHAAEAMYAHVVPGTLVVEGTASYPGSFTKLDDVTYVDLSSEPTASSRRVIANPTGVLATWLGDTKYKNGLIIITRSQKEEADALGELPKGTLDRIERALLASPHFTRLYHDRDASVFALAGTNQQPVGP